MQNDSFVVHTVPTCTGSTTDRAMIVTQIKTGFTDRYVLIQCKNAAPIQSDQYERWRQLFQTTLFCFSTHFKEDKGK